MAIYLVPFIFMAVYTLTILVVGTLAAADLIHRPHAHRAADGSPRKEAAEPGPEPVVVEPGLRPGSRHLRHGRAA